MSCGHFFAACDHLLCRQLRMIRLNPCHRPKLETSINADDCRCDHTKHQDQNCKPDNPGQQKYERKDHRCNCNYNRKPLNDNFSCSRNDCKLHKEIKAFKNAAGTCPCSIFTQIQIIAIPCNFERCLEHLCYDSRCRHEQNEKQCHQNKLEWTEDHAGAIIPPAGSSTQIVNKGHHKRNECGTIDTNCRRRKCRHHSCNS